ncbi:MAG TPA: hypothetical protein VE843_11815 [Ktedonobacteraceae bacterium]|nr:hypothetical protein [Ktedonobacteraceae bacterium]
MASKLTDFLFSLGDDAQQLQDFEQNPQDVMDKAGLTPDEQNMILNRDMKGIRAHLHADPDLRQALGVPADQPLPEKLPMCVFMVPKPRRKRKPKP